MFQDEKENNLVLRWTASFCDSSRRIEFLLKFKKWIGCWVYTAYTWPQQCVVSKTQQSLRICSRVGCVWQKLDQLLRVFLRPLCQVGFWTTHRNQSPKPKCERREITYVYLFNISLQPGIHIICCTMVWLKKHTAKSQKLNVHFSWLKSTVHTAAVLIAEEYWWRVVFSPIHHSAWHTQIYTHMACMGISMWIKGHQLYSHAILFLLCMQTQRGPESETGTRLLGWIIAALQAAPTGQKRRCFQWCLDSVGTSSPFFLCKCVMSRSDVVQERWCWNCRLRDEGMMLKTWRHTTPTEVCVWRVMVSCAEAIKRLIDRKLMKLNQKVWYPIKQILLNLQSHLLRATTTVAVIFLINQLACKLTENGTFWTFPDCLFFLTNSFLNQRNCLLT